MEAICPGCKGEIYDSFGNPYQVCNGLGRVTTQPAPTMNDYRRSCACNVQHTVFKVRKEGMRYATYKRR